VVSRLIDTGLAVGDHRSVVLAQRRRMQPVTVGRAELRAQLGQGPERQLTHGVDAQLFQMGRRLGADALDATHRQRPDAQRHILGHDHRQPIGFVQIAADLGQQLVGRQAD
jgi:hypothetical protein